MAFALPAVVAAANIFLPSIAKHLAGDSAGRVASEIVDVIEVAAGQEVNFEDPGEALEMARDLESNPAMAAELTLRLAEIEAREDADARAMEFEAITAQIKATADLAAIDANSENGMQKLARPAALWGATVSCVALIFTVIYAVIWNPSALGQLVGVMPFITLVLGALLAVGGVYVWARHREKQTGVAGPGVAKLIDDLI